MEGISLHNECHQDFLKLYRGVYLRGVYLYRPTPLDSHMKDASVQIKHSNYFGKHAGSLE